MTLLYSLNFAIAIECENSKQNFTYWKSCVEKGAQYFAGHMHHFVVQLVL